MKKLIDKKDKFYVAGHNGMVGSAICRKLKENNYNNILTTSRSDLDLRNYESVKKWFADNKPDVVIVAAARVGGILANNSYPTEFLLDNMKIQNNIIEIAWTNNVKRLLFLGSSCIYPKLSNQPMTEESLLTGELEKTNEWYALAKITGIKLCDALRKQYKFDAICLMPTNLYGSGDNYHREDSHVIPGLIRRFHEAKLDNLQEVICWGTGKPLREFLYVDDLGSASIFALENWRPKDYELNYLNVGSGAEISIKDLAILIASIVNFKGEIKWDDAKPDGTPRKLLDTTKINKFGWNHSVNLQDGIRKSYKSFMMEINDNNIRK
tara:strand:- start:16795 stop:17766 length:972 start_codon:yes stop_codon:yes gene_type:complete